MTQLMKFSVFQSPCTVNNMCVNMHTIKVETLEATSTESL